jgi:folate-binding protein YgfZ
MPIARLSGYGLLRVDGADARSFLHAQLTADIAGLDRGQARRAGWCSAKGRLLATFLVLSHGDAFLMQLARDLAAPVARRLATFVLRAKVRIADESDRWLQHGLWGPDATDRLAALGVPVSSSELGVGSAGATIAVRLGPDRFLLLGACELSADATEEQWILQEIRAGVPWITAATQDRLVPQMANFEAIGGVDFRKGCYPGQEVVARAQYRGAVKRRLYRMGLPTPLAAGQDLYSDDSASEPAGIVVNAAGGEALVVLPVASVAAGCAVRAAPGAEPLTFLPLPYTV